MNFQVIKYIFQAAILIAADQVTKREFASSDFFIGPLRIRGMRNYNLPFGLDAGAFDIPLLIIAAGIFVWLMRRSPSWKQGAILMVAAGATSNMIDRAQFGYVRDFLDIGLGFTFNPADVFIVIGLFWLLRKRVDYTG